jgi:hypothetical protein
MIIQSTPEGTSPLIVRMWQHTAFCEQFARAFGNATFEAPKPLDLVAYVIGHHDAGWEDFDIDPAINPHTSLPYNLVETPAEFILETSRRSPDYNEKHHPYCGLLSSMHSWGLYNGRYGLSNLVLLDSIARDSRSKADVMLSGELKRQSILRDKLASDPATAGLLDEKRIFQNYKQLQFCDTLALYFNRDHPRHRKTQTFRSVPVDAETDVEITINPVSENVYALTPFPFATSGSEFGFGGIRVTEDTSETTSFKTLLRQAPAEWEVVKLVDRATYPND